MENVRWEQIQALFHKAAALPVSEQSAFLKDACGADEKLLADVLLMLEDDRRGSPLLDGGLSNFAEQMLGDDPSSLPRTEFGPYRVVRLLGEGGMALVYLGERQDFGRQVAIKVLRDAWLSPSRRDRFASEQRMLAQLIHPSIARLYDADTLDNGTPYFVMEYVEGLPFTEFCTSHQCSIEERLRLFRAVCEAVQYAHAHAVIHRDLKPSNILVKEDGSVRLLDFGIAKQIEGLDAPVNQTMTGLRLLTPAYAAPEQIRGQQVGVHVDVYSLGVILFELLTGELPFDLSNLTPGEAATIVAEDDPGKPSARHARHALSDGGSALSKSAWADLDVMCLTAMHKDPQRRYQSVEALVRDLDHYLKGEPLEARPDSIRYRAAKFVRRNLRAVMAAAAVLLAVIALTVFFTWRLTRARNAALAEAARTQRIQRFMITVFQGGDEAAGPAANLRIIDMLDRGVHEAEALSSDPTIRADLLYNFATIYQKQGQLDKAESLLRSALDQRKTLFGNDSAQVAETLTAVALLRSDQSRLDEAESYARQGLAMANRHLAANHPQVAAATVALGRILGDRGSYEEAIRLLEPGAQTQPAAGAAPSDLANSLSALAEVNYRAGRYAVCIPLYHRLLELHRQIYGPQHPLLADDLGSLGAAQMDLGYYSEAEQFSRQALEITTTYYGKDSPKAAANLTTLGRALMYQKKYDEATGVLQQALSIQERAYGSVHSSVADTLNELGNIAYMRDQLEEAERKYRRVVEIYRAIYGDHHYYVAVALSNVGSVRLDKKDYAAAEQIYRDVVGRFTEALSPDNVNTGIAHVKLGRSLLRAKRFKEAEAETLAGYDVLMKQTNPSTSYVRAARKDLIAEYEGLGQPERAARFRAELATEDKSTKTVSKE